MTAPVGDELRVGDLVVCASRSFREEARLGLDVGMFLLGRRRDALVFFAGPDRSLWMPARALRAVDADDARVVPPPGWVVQLNRAIRLLQAIDVELERREEGGGFEARIGCPGLDATLFRQIEALAGDAKDDVRVRPGSMSRVLVVYPVGIEAQRPQAAGETARDGPGPRGS